MVVAANHNEVVKNVGDTVRATNRILITGACGFIGSHLVNCHRPRR